jgi:tetratricopeptide (TPR) repeat protein
MPPGPGFPPPITQRLALAMQHQQAGRLAEAEALYRGILQEAPQHPHALHLLGLLANQAGRHRDAIDLINRALAVHGPHPIFYSNLGVIHLDLGLLPETVAYCREAIRLQPDMPDAHNNLGLALWRLGQYDGAEAAFRAALRYNPRHLNARCNLGGMLYPQGRLNEAVALLQEAVRLAPNFAPARDNLGGALLACGQPDPALEHLQEAVRLRPDFAESQSNLGLAFRELGRIEEAIRCFREAMRLNPAYPGAHNNLGYTLEFQGRFEEALAEFQEALRLDPNNARALASLSGLAVAGHHHLSDDQLSRIRSLVSRTDLPADDLGRLHFALAGVLDGAGDYERAFGHYRQGNELRKEYVRRRGAAFDPEAQRRGVDRLIDAFTPAYFERVRSFGADSELPIFVVGMMRSGTSLAEQILASHPDVRGAGELRDIDLLVRALPQRWGPTEGYPACLVRLDATAARQLAEGHLRRLRERGGAAARVVDKAPFNFLHLGVIATLFPRARIIHCRRDPVDTCLSCYFQDFGQPPAFSLDLRHLGLYYREYERLMAHWAAVLPVPIFELCYEELTADQEAVSRRLIAFCGLEWDDRCLRFHETRRPVWTSSTLQVRRPMYRSAVGRWKRYEAHLRPLLEALGDR